MAFRGAVTVEDYMYTPDGRQCRTFVGDVTITEASDP